MGYIIPIINRDAGQVRDYLREKVQQERMQKLLVLVTVSIILLLDNMLFMVIVPIIPRYLRELQSSGVVNQSSLWTDGGYANEDVWLGWLFAIKAIMQLLVNPFSGTLIDRIGHEVPMIIGLGIMFCSTVVFAFGRSYGVLFCARGLQGVGSAFADTSGLAMIADRFTVESERNRAIGIAQAFISFGSLVAPPFGGIMYDRVGAPAPFLLLSLVCLLDGIMVFMVIQPKARRTENGERIRGTPIHLLFMDPYIAICAGALVMANVSLAFLEPTITKHIQTDNKNITVEESGLIWLPAFFPHVAGVCLTVYLMNKHAQLSWQLAAAGLVLEGVSCLFIPFITDHWLLILPLSVLCFGIALLDTSLLPLLGYLVDTRHVSVYGSVYAIADISYSLAYAFGPVFAGSIVETVKFVGMNIIICLLNLLYAPVLSILRRVYVYKAFNENELNDFNAFGGGVTKGYGALADSAHGDLNHHAAGQQQGVGADGSPFVDYGYDYPQQQQQQGEIGGRGQGQGQARPSYPPLPTSIGPQKPQHDAQFADSLFEKALKQNKNVTYRDYRDTDRILDDDEYQQ